MSKSPLTISIMTIAAFAFVVIMLLLGTLSYIDSVKKGNEPVVVQEEPVDLETLITQAESALEEANQLGFAWSVTEPLLEEARAAHKAGDEEQATVLFQEAKHQATLAIEQAHYAEKNWQLLVPVINK